MKPAEIIFGVHAVHSFLQAHAVPARLYVSQTRGARHQALIALAQANDVPVYQSTADFSRVLEQHGVPHDVTHQGVVLEVLSQQPAYEDIMALVRAKTSGLLLLILDGVVDPHNLGACIRTAATFGVDAVVIPKDKAVGVNATVRKVAAGAVEHVPVFAVTNLARTMTQLAAENIWCYGLSEHADLSVEQVQFPERVAVVMGGEQDGIRALTAKKCDHLLCLPTCGTFKTLNVSVATGVALYAVSVQR